MLKASDGRAEGRSVSTVLSGKIGFVDDHIDRASLVCCMHSLYILLPEQAEGGVSSLRRRALLFVSWHDASLMRGALQTRQKKPGSYCYHDASAMSLCLASNK